MMELYAKVVESWKPLNIFAKSSILYVWKGSKYTSDFYTKNQQDPSIPSELTID